MRTTVFFLTASLLAATSTAHAANIVTFGALTDQGTPHENARSLIATFGPLSLPLGPIGAIIGVDLTFTTSNILAGINTTNFASSVTLTPTAQFSLLYSPNDYTIAPALPGPIASGTPVTISTYRPVANGQPAGYFAPTGQTLSLSASVPIYGAFLSNTMTGGPFAVEVDLSTILNNVSGMTSTRPAIFDATQGTGTVTLTVRYDLDVPEPMSAALLGSALLALTSLRRRR